MGRGCLTTLTFFGTAAGVFLLGILWFFWMNSTPPPAGDSGGTAMGTFAILITVVPVIALIAAAVTALIVYDRNKPKSGE